MSRAAACVHAWSSSCLSQPIATCHALLACLHLTLSPMLDRWRSWNLTSKAHGIARFRGRWGSRRSCHSLMAKLRVDCNRSQEIRVYKTNHPSLNELLLDVFNPQIIVFFIQQFTYWLKSTMLLLMFVTLQGTEHTSVHSTVFAITEYAAQEQGQPL